MVNSGRIKVAIGCQGGGMHAASRSASSRKSSSAARGPDKENRVRTGGLERDVGRRPVRADGLVRPCSERMDAPAQWMKQSANSSASGRTSLP